MIDAIAFIQKYVRRATETIQVNTQQQLITVQFRSDKVNMMSIRQKLKTMLKKLEGTNIYDYYYINMSSVQKELQISNCSDRGLYYDGSCQCDLGYFGVQCEQKLEELHLATYYTFIGFFLILFTILLLFTLKQLQLSLKMNKIPSYQKGCNYIKNVLGSPLNCILCLTILFSILKILWLALDPFQLYDYKERVCERILAEVVYTILFYIYGILLMVWYTMYDEISFNISEKKNNNLEQQSTSKSENRKFILAYYKDIMKIRLFLVLIIQLTVSTLNGLRLGQQYKTILYIAYVILLLNFMQVTLIHNSSFIFEFLLYGRSLNQCIEQQLKRLDLDNREQEREEKLKLAKNNQQTILSKTQLNLQQEDQLQSPATPDQQILRLSSLSASDESHEQRDTSRAIISIEKIQPPSFLKKQVTFRSPQSIPTQQNTEVKREVLKTSMRTILSEESQNSLHVGEVSNHQKVNSCLLNEDDFDQTDFNWNIKKERANVKKIKKQQIKIVEKIKLQVNETKRQKKATIKNSNNIKDGVNQDSFQIEDDKKIKSQLAQAYQAEMLAQQKQIRTANLNADKKVLSKIQMLIYVGVLLEICFGALSIVILLTDLLKKPVGTICYLYISAMLQFLSLITVLKLFRDVKSQEVLNLIWIQKVGNRKNKINQKYYFTIPFDQTRQDESKRKFEQRINMHIR
ncbi:unnamed protein product (macronuclear) [Paramecium tetraurelia]|uniref:EGF-like domain-containing protein n=1 Tax=Paramecium tetraurelia TaxID=5888 RepID=A0BE92_PARTE|nr:uncharacterized protein GSPATT00027892001 [Paramecium tetraurelia]CAK56859.1 unnamed protein product [Paramecium tetraurelia]|eukprot:XP_001424257.1 hypothetical protein (macronuclear) [Paramecium tetraurelia strain d4-2]